MKEKPPEIQLGEFIAKFTPEIAEVAWESFNKLRKRLAGAVIFVYDNSYALVMGFGPTERPSEAFLSRSLSIHLREHLLPARDQAARSAKTTERRWQAGASHPPGECENIGCTRDQDADFQSRRVRRKAGQAAGPRANDHQVHLRESTPPPPQRHQPTTVGPTLLAKPRRGNAVKDFRAAIWDFGRFRDRRILGRSERNCRK